MSERVMQALVDLFRLTTAGRYLGDDDTLVGYTRMLAGRDPALVEQACDAVARRWTGHSAPPIGVVLTELAEIGRRSASTSQPSPAAERRQADSPGLRAALQAGQVALRQGMQQAVDHGICQCGTPADFTFPASFAGYGPAGPTCLGCVSRHLEGVRRQRSRELKIAEDVYRRIRQGQSPTMSEQQQLRAWGLGDELNGHLRAAGMLSGRRDDERRASR